MPDATNSGNCPRCWRAWGSKITKIFETKKPKSTLLADNTQGLITAKQTKPRSVASVAPHPIVICRWGVIWMNGGSGGGEWMVKIIQYYQITPPPTDLSIAAAARALRARPGTAYVEWSRTARPGKVGICAFEKWQKKKGGGGGKNNKKRSLY